MTEETTIRKSWYMGLLTPQTIVYLLGGVIALIIFWIRTKESWDKVKELERIITTRADIAETVAIKEQITRQYSTNRSAIESLEKEIDEIRDWMNFEKGKQSVSK